MINSMRQLLSVVAENLLLLETEEPLDITAVPDGPIAAAVRIFGRDWR